MRGPPTGHPQTLAWLPRLPRCRKCLEAGLPPWWPVWGGRGDTGCGKHPLAELSGLLGGRSRPRSPASLHVEQRWLVSLSPRRWRRCLEHGGRPHICFC